MSSKELFKSEYIFYTPSVNNCSEKTKVPIYNRFYTQSIFTKVYNGPKYHQETKI